MVAPALSVAPVRVTLAGLVGLKVGVVAEQLVPLSAVTPVMVRPLAAVKVSVKVMPLCAGLPTPLVRVKVRVLLPVMAMLALL